jgi:hypothetical protein
MTTETTTTNCEAADRNQRALHELNLQWGSRELNYGKLRDILSGEDSHD